MRKTPKVAAAAAALSLALAGGIAAAAGGPPSQADDGLSTASEHSGIEVPANADHPTDTTETTEAPEIEPDTSSAEHPDNHGADVSAVAQSTDTTGADHGAAVSAVARDNAGQNDHAGLNDHADDTASDHADDDTP